MSHEKKEMMNRALNAMTINIGKSGVNDNVIEEIKRQEELIRQQEEAAKQAEAEEQAALNEGVNENNGAA